MCSGLVWLAVNGEEKRSDEDGDDGDGGSGFIAGKVGGNDGTGEVPLATQELIARRFRRFN